MQDQVGENCPTILLKEFHSTAWDKNKEPKQNSATSHKILGNYELFPFEKKNRQAFNNITNFLLLLLAWQIPPGTEQI